MWPFRLLLFISFVIVVVAESLPECAVSCGQRVYASNVTVCAPMDMRCLCADREYQSALAECVLAECTVRDSLTATRVGSRMCDKPMQEGRPVVEGATLAPLILATVFFSMRLVAKWMGLGGGWGWDDVTIGIAWALGVVIFALNASMIHYGFGQNLWDITPLSNITQMYKRFYGLVICYKVQISLAKISVCLFLLRIFQSATFRYVTYTTIALNAAIAFTWVFVDAFWCIPVHLSWTGWASEDTGKCINFIESTLVNCFLNIAVDLIMILMPVSEVLQLTLSLRKKIGICVMFGMGLVLTAIAILRVVVLFTHQQNTNPSVDLQPITHWSVIECQIAVICACLPASRALLVRFFPTVLGGSSNHSYEQDISPSPSQRRISRTVTYSVDYSERGANKSFIQLEQVESAKPSVDV